LLPLLWRRHLSELCIDWWHETLLANQNTKPAATNQYNASGANAGANPAAENAQHANVLSGDTEMGETDNSTFGYAVHNGPTTNDF
jgi:nuclear transcription Y subunit beta